MRINVETIPHNEQRYETVGDYWMDGDTLEVRISDMGNSDYEFLVSIHELIEAYICLKEGIDFKEIDKFDKRFEKMREDYPDLIGDDEPGNSEKSPYNRQHRMASMFEKWVADNMQVNWEEYEAKVNSL